MIVKIGGCTQLMEAGNWFHSGIVRNTVEFQSGDDFRVALGHSSLSGLETPLVLFDFLMSTVSGGDVNWSV